MKARLWWVLDSLAHFLYVPLYLGTRSGRADWRERVHLIPGSWMAWVCDRYELALGVTAEEMRRTAGEAGVREFYQAHKGDPHVFDFDSAVAVAPRTFRSPADEFAEFDMTEEEFDRAFAAGIPAQIVVPVGWRCQHVSITVGGDAVAGGPATAWCGCKMAPIFR